MAVPRTKISKSKRNMRRAHDALSHINVVECKNCGADRLPHHICAECGHYNGRAVVVMNDNQSEED